MLERVSSYVFFVLLDASCKALVIWALAAIVIRAFRGLSVHSRHLVWTFVTVAFLVLPIVICRGPSWTIPLGSWLNHKLKVDDRLSERLSSPPKSSILTDRHPADLPGRHSIDRRAGPLEFPTSSEGAKYEPADRAVTQIAIPTSVDHSPSYSFLAFNFSSLTILAMVIWLFGSAIVSVRLFSAIVQASRIHRGSRLIHDEDFPAGIMIRESDAIHSPVIIGLWRSSFMMPGNSCILLPNSWKQWSRMKLKSVFSHEVSHVRRGDPQLSLLAEVMTLIYWFHPISWWLKRTLSELAELACDEVAAIAVGDRLLYARCLVEIAAENRPGASIELGTAMARSSGVGQRVQALLDLSRPLTEHVSRLTMTMILVVGIPVLVYLGSFRLYAATADEDGKDSQSEVRPNDAPVEKAIQNIDSDAKKSATGNHTIDANLQVVTLKGTALLPDGSIAKNAILEHSKQRGINDALSASMHEGHFEVRTTGTTLNPGSFLIRTPDSDLMARLEINDLTLRKESSTPKTVTLAPPKVILVKVSEKGRLVADCHVQVESGSVNYSGTTRADGIAKVKIASGEGVFMINAWTDDHRIGGVLLARKPTKEQLDSKFSLEISRSEPVRVRVVDKMQRPVANVPLEFVSVQGDHGELFVGSNPTSYQTSDAAGEAVFRWVPENPTDRTYVRLLKNDDWREITNHNTQQTLNGVRQLIVAPTRTNERVTVTAQLAGVTTDVSGLLVEFWSFQGEESHTCDVCYARCNATGQFSARILPGSEYSVFVNDPELASDLWGGTIALSQEATIREPVLTLTEGVPVEIQVTKGPDQEPMKNAWINFDFTNKKITGDRNLCSRRFWGKTDDQGQCTVHIAAGELQVRVNDGDWESEKSIEIIQGNPMKLSFHRKFPKRNSFEGRLILPKGVAANLREATVKIAGMDGESMDEDTVQSDAQGKFSGAISAGRVSILATSNKEDLFGCGIFDLNQGVIEVVMHPTVTYEGHVVDQQNRPVAGAKVRMLARLEDHEQKPPQGPPGNRRNFVDLFRDRAAVTDQDGNFFVPNTPQKMELLIFVTGPGETNPSAQKTQTLDPSQEPSFETFQLGKQRIQVNGPVEKEVDSEIKYSLRSVLRDCRLAGLHALVIVSGEGPIATRFLEEQLLEPKDARDITSYLLKMFDGPTSAEIPDRREFFADRNWPFPKKDGLFIAAIDGDFKELGRLTVDLNDHASAIKQVAGFLRKHQPPQRDAELGYEAALLEAKASNRKVWVRVSKPRSDACIRFSRWLDSQQELLSKDYVMFQFDEVRDRNGAELSASLNLKGHGIPCHAILDADGKQLISSISPLGNIGAPSENTDVSEHLQKMLKMSAQKLSEEDIDNLIGSIHRDE